MALEFPTRKQLEYSSKTDVQQSLAASNPFLKNSFLGAIVKAIAFRIFDFYIQLQAVLREAFWDTSTGDYLVRQAGWFGITKNPATKSSGYVVASGVAGSAISAGESLKDSNGAEYTTTAAATVSANALTLASLTRSGATATATTASAHNLASGVTSTISGAVEADYNGSFVVTVTSATTFTYTLTGTPTTPATGTISATQTTAYVDVSSVDFGASVNRDSGARLSFVTPIAGVNNYAYVPFVSIAGGSDQEKETFFRNRFLDRVRNPIALFNVAAIENQAKLVAGTTRVFVREVTPAAGQVTVYFVRDNDANIIPTATDVANVKTSLLLIKPAHTSDADVIVTAPTAKTVDFSFSALSPNTTTMQASISASLAVLFRDNTDVGADLTEDSYRSAIYNTIDSETGSRVLSFTLSTPTGNVAAAAAEIPILGTVSY